jgi:hypothetical protein
LEDTYGGGIQCVNSDIKVLHSRISHCRATSSVDHRSTGGGGIYVQDSQVVISYCDIGLNSVYQAFPGGYAFGGGIFISDGITSIVSYNWIHDYVIINSDNAIHGSAISCIGEFTPTFLHNLLTGGDQPCYCLFHCGWNSSMNIVSNVLMGNDLNGVAGDGEIEYGGPDLYLDGNIIVGFSHYGVDLHPGNRLWIRENLICGNGWGGIDNSFGHINGNVITDNGGMGGIVVTFCPQIVGNTVCRNIHGIRLNDITAMVSHNRIYDNEGFGCTVSVGVTSPYDYIWNNIVFNNNSGAGGGIYYNGASSSVYLTNNIVWNNSPHQLNPGNCATVTYCDIQSGWPGMGNLDTNPMVIDTAYQDFRLLWGSPCIDSGHPDSLDPDGTRADMGVDFFDQRLPVHVLLTPHHIPYLIPAAGGNMEITVRLYNWSNTRHFVTAWCNVTLPDSSMYGPLLGPLSLTIPAHTMLARVRTQFIPASAPLGVYHYNAFTIIETDTSRDSFLFGKLGSTGNGLMVVNDWSNTGDDFGAPTASTNADDPSFFSLHDCVPNPFNPTTVISYELRAASYVSLRVYDLAGRLVATLIDGQREAGTHEITFDGSDLASGIYLARLETESFRAVQKLVLIK